MRFGTLPPTAGMPARIVNLAAELEAVRLRRSEARRKAFEVNGTGVNERARLDQAAAKADAALLAEAARNGKPIGKVGSPNMDALTKARADADREVEALETAVAMIERELGEAVTDAGTELAELADHRVDAAHTAYVAAIDALEIARRKFAEAVALRSFVERSQSGTRGDVNYVVKTTGAIGDDRGLNAVTFVQVAEAMRREAELQGRRPERRTTTGKGFGVTGSTALEMGVFGAGSS